MYRQGTKAQSFFRRRRGQRRATKGEEPSWYILPEADVDVAQDVQLQLETKTREALAAISAAKVPYNGTSVVSVGPGGAGKCVWIIDG
jgi:hypothetical protein